MKTFLEIDDSPFVRSHMKAPRGFGSWAFSTEPNPKDVCRDVQFTPAMNWSDAKVWIKAWFRDQQAAGVFPADIDRATLFAQP